MIISNLKLVIKTIQQLNKIDENEEKLFCSIYGNFLYALIFRNSDPRNMRANRKR